MNARICSAAVLLAVAIGFAQGPGCSWAMADGGEPLFTKTTLDGSSLRLEKETGVRKSSRRAGKPVPEVPGAIQSGKDIPFDHYQLILERDGDKDVVWQKTVDRTDANAGLGPRFVFWDALLVDGRIYIFYSEKLRLCVDVVAKNETGRWAIALSEIISGGMRFLGLGRVCEQDGKVWVEFIDGFDTRRPRERWDVLEDTVQKRAEDPVEAMKGRRLIETVWTKTLSDGTILTLEREALGVWSVVSLAKGHSAMVTSDKYPGLAITNYDYSLTMTHHGDTEIVWEKKAPARDSGNRNKPGLVFWDALLVDGNIYVLFSARLLLYLEIVGRNQAVGWTAIALERIPGRNRIDGSARLIEEDGQVQIEYLDASDPPVSRELWDVQGHSVRKLEERRQGHVLRQGPPDAARP